MKITLCGSARFEEDFHKANLLLTLRGHTVYGLAIYPSAKGGEHKWYSEYEKILLDLAHLRKISESDAIAVVGDGYIGFSTSREILWAQSLEKAIYYFDENESDLLRETFDIATRAANTLRNPSAPKA